MITNDKLMVGDFVKDSESNRVLSIFALHELCAAGTDNIKQEYDMDYDNIMGLPLCDAILEIDTRWEDIFDPKCHKEGGMLITDRIGLFKFKDKYWLGLYFYDGVEKIREIKYVHELQHILTAFDTSMAANILNADYVYTIM